MTKKIEEIRRILKPVLENPKKYQDAMIKKGMSKDGTEVTSLILSYQVLEAAEEMMVAANRLKNEFSELMKKPEFRKFHAEQIKKVEG